MEDRAVVVDIKDGDQHRNYAYFTQGRGTTSTSYPVCLQDTNK